MKVIAWIQTLMLTCGIIAAFTSVNHIITYCALALCGASAGSLYSEARAFHAERDANALSLRISRSHSHSGISLVSIGVVLLGVGQLVPQALPSINLVLVLSMVWAGIGLLFERHA